MYQMGFLIFGRWTCISLLITLSEHLFYDDCIYIYLYILSFVLDGITLNDDVMIMMI